MWRHILAPPPPNRRKSVDPPSPSSALRHLWITSNLPTYLPTSVCNCLHAEAHLEYFVGVFCAIRADELLNFCLPKWENPSQFCSYLSIYIPTYLPTHPPNPHLPTYPSLCMQLPVCRGGSRIFSWSILCSASWRTITFAPPKSLPIGRLGTQVSACILPARTVPVRYYE